MTTKRVLVVLALGLLVLPACRRAKLYNPDPITAAATIEKTERAIKMALAGRGWVVSKAEPGEMRATLTSRGHIARIVINYNQQDVTIKYDSSQDLDYQIGDDGQPEIHKNYNKWIQHLVRDINKNLLYAGSE